MQICMIPLESKYCRSMTEHASLTHLLLSLNALTDDRSQMQSLQRT